MNKKILALTGLLLGVSLPGWTDEELPPAQPVSPVIALTDVVKKVSTENYYVLENALRVYQAKEAIQVARGALLPSLNLWKIAGMVLDPMSMVGMITDIAPFLVPANWFRVEEQKLLFYAEKEAYRALWANEVMTAKGLYLRSLADQALLELIRSNVKDLQDLLVIVRSREMFGGVKAGTSREIEIRQLALQEDERAMQVLVGQELGLLSYVMGFKGNVNLVLTPVAMPDFDSMKPLDYDDFEFRALDTSAESRQYAFLIEAADYVKKEVTFSFLGTSTLSRGVAGGVFDNLPLQDGLGFGTAASFRIAKAKKEALKIQKAGVEETLKRQLNLVISNYNLDLGNYSNLKRRVFLTDQSLKQLQEKMRLGETVDSLELVESSRNRIQAEASFFSVKVRFLANEDKLARLIFYGDYEVPPAVIDELKERP